MLSRRVVALSEYANKSVERPITAVLAKLPILVFNLLKTKPNLIYIRNQSVPRSKHFLPWL